MEHRPSRRRWLLLLAPAMAATGLVLWLQARRPLDHTVQGCLTAADGSVSAPEDRGCDVVFEDDTRITLARGTRGRINAHDYRRGASFTLDHGQVDLAVVHRETARWNVLAGPFDVRVTGTRFSVDWVPNTHQFTLRVSQGEVHVSGCSQYPDTAVRAGQGLVGDAARTCSNLESPAAAPSPALPVARAEAPEPPRAAPAPAPLSRQGRKRAPAKNKLAMRSPEDSGKVERQPPPDTMPSPPDVTTRSWNASSGLAPEIRLGPRRLTVGSAGRLTGPEPGSLVALGGLATTFSFPSRHVGSTPKALNGEINGTIDVPWAFSSPPTNLGNNLYLEDGALCTRGRIAELNCDDEKIPNLRCDWKTNWGALIQWQPRDGQAWGKQATSSIALEYRGKSSSYSLVAHRQGDPDDRTYCISNYRSGERVTPSHFTLHCWASGGAALADFNQVDYFALQISSAETDQRFRFCISAIDLR